MQPEYTPARTERFWSKVDRNGPILDHRPDLGPCWLWTGYCNRLGYGICRPFGKRYGQVLAHRAAFWITTGINPGSLHVLHACDNPTCVRPNHLFLGTQIDNMHDMAAKGRASKGDEHVHAKLTSQDVVAILELAGSMTQREIAARYGVRRQEISRVIRGDRWQHLTGLKPKPTNRRAALTDLEKMEIRLLSATMTQAQIARIYGIDASSISNLLHGRRSNRHDL